MGLVCVNDSFGRPSANGVGTFHNRDQVRYNQLRDQIMNATQCSKRTAQLAIAEACQQGWIAQANGQYLLPL
jgi:hypothetical protein